MALMQCQKCGKAFDTSLIPEGAPLTCPYCGFANSKAMDVTNPNIQVTPQDFANEPQSSSSVSSTSDQREMCEWERDWKTHPFRAYVNTFREVILHPIAYFGRIKPFEDYLALAVLIYISSFLGTLASVTTQLFMSVMPSTFTGQIQQVGFLQPSGVVGYICGAIIGSALAVLIVFVLAGLLHLLIQLIAGSEKDYNTTLTVYAISTMTAIFYIVPFFGYLIQIVYTFIFNIGGQAKAHEVSPWKVFVAWMIPVLIFCCCCGGGLAMFFSNVAGNSGW